MPGRRNVFLCATPVQFLVLDKHSQRSRDGLCHSTSRWQHTQHRQGGEKPLSAQQNYLQPLCEASTQVCAFQG